GHGRSHRRREDRAALQGRRGGKGGRRAAAAEIAAGDIPQCPRQWRRSRSENRRQDVAPVSSLQSVIVMLSVGYALIGALLLLVLVYARLPWQAKAFAVIVTSAFYVVSFVGMRGLLGWASVDRLPPNFKLLQARIIDPHTVDGDPGSVYLWVEALDEDNRPSGIPRAYRLPYSDALAEKTQHASDQIAAGH